MAHAIRSPPVRRSWFLREGATMAATVSVSDMQMRERIKADMRALNDIQGISGFEQGVVAYLRPRFAELADEVFVDRFGNLFATRRGSRAGPAVVLSAHSDEIGGMVNGIHPH